MPGEVASFLAGTSGLVVLLAAALATTFARAGVAAPVVGRVRWAASAGVAFQAVHFAEELLTGFHREFPEYLGFAAWPPALFATFNLFWLVLWALSIAGLARFPRVAAFPLWFLGIAAVVNGLAHPLLSVATAGYFPGTGSSLFLAIAGGILLRELAAATRPVAAVS